MYVRTSTRQPFFCAFVDQYDDSMKRIVRSYMSADCCYEQSRVFRPQSSFKPEKESQDDVIESGTYGCYMWSRDRAMSWGRGGYDRDFGSLAKIVQSRKKVALIALVYARVVTEIETCGALTMDNCAVSLDPTLFSKTCG